VLEPFSLSEYRVRRGKLSFTLLYRQFSPAAKDHLLLLFFLISILLDMAVTSILG